MFLWEKINMDRFCSLGVIEEVVKRPMTGDRCILY